MGSDSAHLPLGVHLQNVHHVDVNVLVGLLVLAHPQRYGEPAGSTRAHVAFAALLPPLAHLEGDRTQIMRKGVEQGCLLLSVTQFSIVMKSMSSVPEKTGGWGSL